MENLKVFHYNKEKDIVFKVSILHKGTVELQIAFKILYILTFVGEGTELSALSF